MKNLLKYAPIALTGLPIIASEYCQPISVKVDDATANFYLNEYSIFIKPVQLNPYSEVVEKVNSFFNLGENWDGNGAIAPDQNVLINATRFINSMPSSVIGGLESDSITPTPYGTVVFDFRNNNDLVSIEIGEKQIGFFSEFEHSNDINIEGRMFNQENLPRELISAINTLYKESFS